MLDFVAVVFGGFEMVLLCSASYPEMHSVVQARVEKGSAVSSPVPAHSWTCDGSRPVLSLFFSWWVLYFGYVRLDGLCHCYSSNIR